MLLDILFPKKCVSCQREGTYFCQACVATIKQGDLVCPRCEKLSLGGQTHPICHRKFGLDGLWSLGVYQDPLKKAIQKIKYKPYLVKDLVSNVVDILIAYWATYGSFVFDQIKKDQGEGWVVMSVPLHWWRENDRGFNQSAEIAKLIAQKLGLKYLEGLTRIRYTKSQAKLTSDQRRANIFRAFEISSNYTLFPKPYLSKGKASFAYTLLIDDVWTTGSTLKECCYILKRAGVKKVWALTLAR